MTALSSRACAALRTFACLVAFVACAAGISLVPTRADAAFATAERSVLQQYLVALQAGRYDRAYALLSSDEQKYFRSAANYASVFAADRLKIESFSILASKTDRVGTVALVNERIEFFDQAHQTPGHASAKVAYGILPAGSGYAIKDPYHPWRALAPAGLVGETSGVRVIVRKFSFYTGRLEMVATFQNTADRPVTLLPYGRSSLRDESGKSYPPIASKLAGLTDKTLYTGLRLPVSGEYTGLMTFLTPDRFAPASLTLTVAPVLFDGGDTPFVVPLPAFPVPK
jgi:hypothetical protein